MKGARHIPLKKLNIIRFYIPEILEKEKQQCRKQISGYQGLEMQEKVDYKTAWEGFWSDGNVLYLHL